MELLFWCPSEESQTVYKRPLIHQLIRRARFTVFAKIFVFFWNFFWIRRFARYFRAIFAVLGRLVRP